MLTFYPAVFIVFVYNYPVFTKCYARETSTTLKTGSVDLVFKFLKPIPEGLFFQIKRFHKNFQILLCASHGSYFFIHKDNKKWWISFISLKQYIHSIGMKMLLKNYLVFFVECRDFFKTP